MHDRGVVKGIVWAVFRKIPLSDFNDPREGGDIDRAVVGFALRFALNARPTGSQGFAPGKPTTKTRTKTQEPEGNQEQSQEQKQQQNQNKRGHF
jgi:hypothetical protein